MANKKSGCSGCGGCNKKDKPKDCKSDGCGKCCGGSCSSLGTKQAESEFLVTLLERHFLPVIFCENKIVYMEENKDRSKLQSYDTIINKFEKQNYLTVDRESLDEYSYMDYKEIIEEFLIEEKEVKYGSLGVTKFALDTFLL